MYQVRLDITVPLYYKRKQRAALTEQVAMAAEARRTYEATNQDLYFQIQDQFLMANASWKLLLLYSKTTVPDASLALESSLSSYESGAVDFLSVLTNYIAILDYEMRYYEEVQNYYVALSKLEEMTGTSLIP
jgi:outer membrane protein TolC